jgi:hypothetical protein
MEKNPQWISALQLQARETMNLQNHISVVEACVISKAYHFENRFCEPEEEVNQ